MAEFKIKLRSVKFKNGGEVRVLPDYRSDMRRYTEQEIRKILDNHGDDLNGYAFVVWSKDGGSTAGMYGGDFPEIAMPDFVRNRLLALKIEKWARL